MSDRRERSPRSAPVVPCTRSAQSGARNAVSRIQDDVQDWGATDLEIDGGWVMVQGSEDEEERSR